MKLQPLLKRLEWLMQVGEVIGSTQICGLVDDLSELAKFAFSHSRFSEGDWVVLAEEIDFKKAPGWKIHQDLLKKGAAGTIKEVSWCPAHFRYSVELHLKPEHIFNFSENQLKYWKSGP